MPSKAISEDLSNYWRKNINTHSQSGYSHQAFCEERYLNYHCVTCWRRNFEQQPARSKSPQSSALVYVACPTDYKDNGLSLHLPNGITLRSLASDSLSVVEQLPVILS